MQIMRFFLALICLSSFPLSVWASEKAINIPAVSMFFIFVTATLFITWWASRRTHTTNDFYAAGGKITGFQNGLAIAGDYMSAASFLGLSGLIFASGFDGIIYSIGFLVGWPIILFLLAERLRNLGRFTFADAVSFRLQPIPIRSLSACGTLTVVLLYLVAQMVGAGKLIEVLFGLPYELAVALVGVLMILYVTFGGMIATTWVQIIKAILLLSGATFLALAVLWAVDFSFERLFQSAIDSHASGALILAPGQLISDPISAISLGLALMFGTAGLPHILMRFFTVPDAKEARKSVVFATGFIGYFYLLLFVIGFGAIFLVGPNADYLDVKGVLIGGSNMAAVHLSQAVGGDFFLGFISAVAFATILAVVSGLTLAGASAISHDVYASLFCKGRPKEGTEILVSKIATIVLGITAMILGLSFENQNVAYMVGLAFAIAASVNFPILFLSMYWGGLTSRGAFVGGAVGLTSAVSCVIFGPTIWVGILGNEQAVFPYKHPALFSMTAAFVSIYLVSILDSSDEADRAKAAFTAQFVRSLVGPLRSDKH